MPEPTEHQIKFVQYLRGLEQREDRGALAALRRGLGKPPGSAPEMFRHVIPWTSQMDGFEEDRYFLVAGLFALHPTDTSNGNIGTTLNGVHRRRGAAEAEDSLEKRFVALLNAHSDDLPGHLRHAVALAHGEDVAVNWAQLLRDLAYWDHPDKFVQRQWAREYWGSTRSTDQPQTASTTDNA